MLARIIITAVSSSVASTAGMPAYSPIWFGPSKVLQYQEAGEAECTFRDEFEQLCDRLIRALAYEPVEDGYTHPGETILHEAFSRFPIESAEWAAGAVDGTLVWPHRAATMKLLARLRPLDSTWRTRIIDIGLQSPDVEIRDATVQAAENWADESLAGLLRAHDEQVVWLKEYIDRVAHDLEG